MSQAKITSKGQVTIPVSVRETLGLETGDHIEFVLTENKEVLLRPVNKKVDEVFGCLAKPAGGQP